MSDFDSLNLDQYLRPIDAPIAHPEQIPGALFEIQSEVQARFLRATQTNLKNFIALSGTFSTTGTFGNSQSVTISTSLTPNPPHQNDKNFAIPFVSVYQGTAATGSLQIFPALGSGISSGVYNAYGGFDFHSTNGTSTSWKGVITNVSAGNVTILLATQWRFVYYNQGTNG